MPFGIEKRRHYLRDCLQAAGSARQRCFYALASTSDRLELEYLQGPYRDGRQWWEPVVYMRRLWLTFGFTFIADPFQRSMFLLLSCCAFVVGLGLGKRKKKG